MAHSRQRPHPAATPSWAVRSSTERAPSEAHFWTALSVTALQMQMYTGRPLTKWKQFSLTLYLRTIIVCNMLPGPEVADLTRIKPEAGGPRKILSELLLGSAREVVILHNGREYRLRVTQNGKLILTA
jgi:hemin uptake protein HemP